MLKTTNNSDDILEGRYNKMRERFNNGKAIQIGETFGSYDSLKEEGDYFPYKLSDEGYLL